MFGTCVIFWRRDQALSSQLEAASRPSETTQVTSRAYRAQQVVSLHDLMLTARGQGDCVKANKIAALILGDRQITHLICARLKYDL